MSDVHKFASLEERQAFLAKVAAANDSWHKKHEGTEADETFDLADSSPHDKESMKSDYPFFYLDRSAPELEGEFFDEAEKFYC